MRIQRPNHALSILTCSIDCCRERVHIQAHFNLPLFNCLMYSVLDFDLIANERNQLQNETNKSQQTKHPSELCICQITITKKFTLHLPNLFLEFTEFFLVSKTNVWKYSFLRIFYAKISILSNLKWNFNLKEIETASIQ